LTGRAVLLIAVALLAAPAAAAGQTPPLAITVDGGVPTVWVGDVLADPAMEDLLRSGLPLRMRFRTELWRDRFFDELVEHVTWNVVVLFEPLEARFLVGPAEAQAPDSYSSYTAARAAIETSYFPPMRQARSGRFYYLASLEIETLTLSDLEELGHWLRGELAPAVAGGRSVTGAVGAGLRRLLIRVLDLPARRYHARSPRFQVE
jgi:hypothetical protein